MAEKIKKAATTVKLPVGVLEVVRSSGVKNMSSYLEGLVLEDLRKHQEHDPVVDRELLGIEKELVLLEKEWFAYLASQKNKQGDSHGS